MNKLKIVGIALPVFIVVVVVLQNTQTVETKLLFLAVTMPNAALLFGTLIIGFAIGVLTLGTHRVTCEASADGLGTRRKGISCFTKDIVARGGN